MTRVSLRINGHLTPAFGYKSALEQDRMVGGTKTHQAFKHTDQFGGELRYFSGCILKDRVPEPDGEEGLADLRVIEAVFEAVKTGRPVKLTPFSRARRIDVAGQEETLAAPSAPEPVDAPPPARAS